jgi:hypothetical protein
MANCRVTALNETPLYTRLCSLCSHIPVAPVLSLEYGYDHYSSFKLLQASATGENYCILCQMLWEAILEGHDPKNPNFSSIVELLTDSSWNVRIYGISSMDHKGSCTGGYDALELRAGNRGSQKNSDRSWWGGNEDGPLFRPRQDPFVKRLYLHQDPWKGTGRNSLCYSTVLLDQSSHVAMELMRWWTKSCIRYHGHEQADDLDRAVLPRRLIDVRYSGRQPRLWTPKLSWLGRRPEYTALSYCWGNSEPMVTTTNNVDRHHSTGFDEARLPRTIRDAIFLTRQLGIRYLWVDALCILQGSDETARADWRRESSKMKEIYGNAFLTIVAAEHEDKDGGIFSVKNLDLQLRYFQGAFGRPSVVRVIESNT